MPQITSKNSTTITQPTNGSYYPKKSVVAESTGVSYAPTEEPRQSNNIVETPTPAQKEATLSPQSTAIARKEQKIREQELALKAEKEAFYKEREQAKQPAQLTESAIKERLSKGEYEVLEQLGVDYEKYVQHLIDKSNANDPTQQVIKKLEAKVNELESGQKQAVDKQYEATVAQYRRDINQTVESQPEFKGIKDLSAQEDVLNHILDTFKEDGDVLTIKEACEDVLAVFHEERKRLAILDEVKEEAVAQEKVLPPPKSGLRTLTNQVTQATPSQPRSQFQRMSMKERIQQSIANAQKKAESGQS